MRRYQHVRTLIPLAPHTALVGDVDFEAPDYPRIITWYADPAPVAYLAIGHDDSLVAITTDGEAVPIDDVHDLVFAFSTRGGDPDART